MNIDFPYFDTHILESEITLKINTKSLKGHLSYTAIKQIYKIQIVPKNSAIFFSDFFHYGSLGQLYIVWQGF